MTRQGSDSGWPEIAISIRQPWAWAILNLRKDIENRDWRTRHRGPVLIHAAKTYDLDGDADLRELLRDNVVDGYMYNPPIIVDEHASRAPRGGIVGIVDITDCVDESDSPWFFGKHGFVLENPRPVEFIPCRGMPGMFRPEIDFNQLRLTDAAGWLG